MPTIPFTPAGDILGYTAPLDHCSLFPFQGLPLKVRSNSPAVVELAERSFRIWHRLKEELIAPTPTLTVDVIVHPAKQPETRLEPLMYRMHSGYLLASSGSNLLMAHADSGVALAFVTPEMVAENEHFFQSYFLESLALRLVTKLDRCPIHAGAVVRKGRPVILIGRGGMGKSTLCYACVREGFQLLAEDVVFASIQDGLILWGGLRNIALSPGSMRYFPDLSDATLQVRSGGEPKIAIDVTELGEERLCLHAEDPVVCVLQRNGLAASNLRPTSSQTVMDALCQDVELGFDMNKNLHEVARALAEREKYILTVGSDLWSAVALLKSITD